MHNTIIEDERDLGRIESPYERGAAETRHFVSSATTSDCVSFVKKHEEIRDSQIHHRLKNDLMEHL
jgi:two-component sensor histidine kinase